MKWSATPIAGAWVLDIEPHTDERGYFANLWNAEEMRAHGVTTEHAQSSVSFNHRAGTIRGMHFQAAPFAEVKIVRCLAGALYDVCLDLRPESPTFRQWYAVELTPENMRALIIPQGCAHGFQTLADHTLVHYQISAPYAPGHARGVRYNDPAFGINWPLPVAVIHPRDAAYADYEG
jgi:dTDP-4-dehydrorhamnose 3,5-epimerase